MRLKFAAITTLVAALFVSSRAFGLPIYTIEQAVAVAQAHNPEIAIARKKVQGAHGGWVEARSGYLPWLSSTGLVDKRQQQTETRLRDEDYNAILKLEQNLYTGGAVPSQVAIARLNIEKQNYELQETASRVVMDVRVAFNELLLNRAKVGVRQNSVRVLQEELKNQQQSFSAGIVGNLNVQRAEVALANEQPELFNAQTQLKNSYLRLGDLFGTDVPPRGGTAPFEISGELQYQPNYPDLNACLARADANRPVIKARQKDVEIEDQQYKLDRSVMRPPARVAQALLQQPSGASMIIYKLRNPNRAPALASRFETLFQHNATSWQDREESTLQLFLTLRMSVAITVSLIILLAGFGIFNVLTMSVLAKTKEIAILRSMGYRRIDISSIFLWQGAMIAAAGSLLGCLLGAVMTWGVSHIPIRLRGLLYTNYFLVTWDWRHYVFATLLAILAVFIASYVPAHRAAQLPPVVTIRGSR